MGEDDGGQFVLVVKEMAAVDVGEWDLVLLPLTVRRGGRRGGRGGREGGGREGRTKGGERQAGRDLE